MNSEPHKKVTVTIPISAIERLDVLVQAGAFPSRSAAFEKALYDILRREMDARIELEVSKLDRELEKADAELGFQDFSKLIDGEGMW